MHKLILGIIAVICLDVGFIAFTGSGDELAALTVSDPVADLNRAAVPNGNLTETPLPTDETPNVAVVKFSPPSSDGPKINRFVRPSVAYHRRENAETGFRSARKDRQSPTSVTSRFPTVVIALQKPSEVKLDRLYARDMPVERRPNIPEGAAKTVSKSNKKSFFGHALRIIKKPYDWTKAIGSKLL